MRTFFALFALACCFSSVSAQLSIGLGGGGSLGLGLGGGGLLGQLTGGLLSITGSLTCNESGYVDQLETTSSGSLQINSGVQLSCGSADFAGGAVACQDSSSQLVLQGASSCASGTTTTFTSGTHTCNYNSGCAMQMQTGSAATYNGVTHQSAYFTADQSSLEFAACTLNGPTEVHGTAASSVTYTSGATVCNQPHYVATPCSVPAGGELRATDSGYVHLEDSYELTLRGGTLGCSGMCASSNNAQYQIVRRLIVCCCV